MVQLTAFTLHSIRMGLSDMDRLLLVAAENATFHDNWTPVVPSTKILDYSSIHMMIPCVQLGYR